MIRITSLLAIVLIGCPAAGLSAAKESSPIKEIHLIHHSHTDLGYTDLLSTDVTLHVDYIRQAIKLADATRDEPEDARFRWTCESALMVDRFLQEASPEEKARFGEAVRRGQIEVAAMPDNLADLIDGPEWAATLERLAPLWKTYGARVAMQNDVNGFPWGLLPSLRRHGIKAVWMGCNGDTSLPLTQTPDAWWWEGPDGRRTLVWSGKSYGFGFFLFHDAEWRRGPVPSAADVWYNPPSAGETWNTSQEDLDKAQRILDRQLASMRHYRHPVIAFQVTNMWRVDNDPPSAQIAGFVKAWNAVGRRPKLVMSTPSRFLARLREAAGDRITAVRRGDWQDWWNDGVATTPELLAANQRAKRILADLPAAARLLGATSTADRLPNYREGWSNAILFDEHTWGSYNSIAQPYHPRSAGGAVQKADLAYRAAEQAALARAAVLRNAKDYCDFSRTRRLRVLNPGTTARSGWVEIPATAIRFPCNAACELASGKIFPLEDLREPEWSDPDLQSAPFDLPNDVWGWQVSRRRFFLSDVRPGQSLDFELVQSDSPKPASGTRLHVQWDEKTGRIASLRTADRIELADAAAAHGLGQIVVETLKDRGQRQALADRNQRLLAKQFLDEPVKLLSARTETTPYASSLITAWNHPLLHRVEQRWDVLNDMPRAVLTTTLWTHETSEPCAIYLAMPFSLPDAKFVYDSVGQETVFGRDSMTGTCAEALCHNAGLLLRSPAATLLLATPDTPVGCVGGTMLRRRIVAPFTPPNAHYYINVANNYWHTNFSILKAGKLVLHHWIQAVDSNRASLPMLSDEFWAYPIAAPSIQSNPRPDKTP
jgi:alpha-mannosidase